jgi:vacuolar-type H+-ATPase subunit E/Vma4
MTEDIQDLIDKIHQDGIIAAEMKAQVIEDEAKRRANAILSQAKRDAEKMLSDAKERIALEDERERALLAQAGRDLLLSLREEINAMLGQIVVSDIRQALTPETISRLLIEIFKNYATESGGDITVSLNKSDMELLERHYLHTLKQEMEREILLKPGDGIRGGFTISYDNGKSSYDFTDKALADYIGTYLKPKLNTILRGAVEE